MPGYVDIQFEHGVHGPLVIVEKGVVYFLTAAHRKGYPFTTRSGVTGRPLCVASPLRRCQRFGDVILDIQIESI